MSRQILCLKCGADFEVPLRGPITAEAQRAQRGLHPLDKAQGWSQRRVFLSNTHTASHHGVTLTVERGDRPGESSFTPMPDLHCDLCNGVVTGQIVVAVSTIPPGKEMRAWEHEYGEVMTPEAVDTYVRMGK